MPTNYKYVDHESASPRRPWRRKLLGLLVLLVFMVGAAYGMFRYRTNQAERLLLTGQYDAATEKVNLWRWFPLFGGRAYEEMGTIRLLQQGHSAAEPFFRKSESGMFWRPAAVWPDVLKILFSNGRYTDGMSYADHFARKNRPEPILHFYRAGFLAGQNRLKEASKELAAAGDLPEFGKEISLLRSEIDQRARTGEYALLFDRENLPLAKQKIGGPVTILSDSIRSVLHNPASDVISAIRQKNPNQAVLTIDYRVQKAAQDALGKYAGAIVVLDSRRGDILAAAANPKGVGGSDHPPEDGSPALNVEYEPGSIIKVITLAGALERGIDLSKIFPFECKGNLLLPGDKLLYDWRVHGIVKDFNTAMAVSCNIAFARIGLAYKPADLLANLKRFGFNGRLHDPFLPLNLGSITESDVTDEYMAKLTIGLEYLHMTPQHAALVASSIANGGVAESPRILLNYRNIIGIPFAPQQPSELERFMSPKTAALLTTAMEGVVQDPEGTGRRAAITDFPFAMKTGTAGEGARGYNAVVIGFGPVPNPRIAFAVFLEHAGKAEFEGARVTKLFLESIRGYILDNEKGGVQN
jgi:hypothetical protein